MSDRPIEALYYSGRTLYVVRHNPDGTVWNKDAAAWQAYSDANWAHYAIPLTEQGTSGYYKASQTIPNLSVLTTDALYQQNGGSPALTDVPGIGMGQSQGANLAAVAGDVFAAQNLAASGASMEKGIVQSGANTTIQAVTNLTGGTANLYRGRVIVFYAGDAVKAAGIITAYNQSTKVLQFTALPLAPSVGDSFVVV